MSVLKHMGYQGDVTFEDGILVIRVLHIDDLIVAECDKASDAQKAFEELVEDYIETCRQVGKEPCKPFKGSFNVRISPSLHREIAMRAAESGVNLNTWVSRAIDQRLHSDKLRRDLLSPQVTQQLIFGTRESTHLQVASGAFAKHRLPTLDYKAASAALFFESRKH